jgi:energy-coupling factor transporter ATP-binding protein EcfA2
MQINKIVLYSLDGKTRVLPFELGKVNIITGESKSGKSALIEILNYCLASNSCDIPEGIIRDSVSYFSVIVTFNDGESTFIARENPNIRGIQASSTVCLVRNIGETIPSLAAITSNINIDTLKEFLTRKIGISENLHIPDSLTREPLQANFKHSRFYCYQPQYLVADPYQLFYNQNKEFIPQSIKDTLPYFLGAVNEDSLLLESEITQLKKLLNRSIREKRESEKIKTEGISQAYSLIAEAKEIGILEKNVNPDSQSEAYKYLAVVGKWEYQPLEVKGENSAIKNLIDQRGQLRNELGKISDNKKAATDYLKNSLGYSAEAKQQEIRLESIRLYNDENQSDSSFCPLCDSKLEIPIPSILNINSSLDSIKNDLKFTKAESPRIQSYLDTIDSQYDVVETELKKIEKSISALYIENENARTLRDLNIRRGKIIGRVSLFLESISIDYETENLDSKIENLKYRINELEREIDSDIEQEKLLSILNKINLQMSKWVDDLDVEYEDSPIRFDINKLTMFIDTEIKPIALPQIGSGANWVAYHLLLVFALHQHFIQADRPVPRFIIIDQPTQVYYPPEKTDEVVEISSDEIAVSKMFNFMFKVVKHLTPHLQVIITDHAYLKDNVDFENSVTEIWRDGLKLIPNDWQKIKYR